MAYQAKPTVTRPANTTAYTAGDVVGGAIAFSGIGPFGGDILITSAALRINVAAIPAGMTSFRLHLYDATPPSALADNAPWDLPAGDRANYLGYIDLGSPADVGSTLYVQADQINRQIRLRTADLHGYLATNGGFTPAGNSEVYVPELNAVRLEN
jgi:hypothetical protein